MQRLFDHVGRLAGIGLYAVTLVILIDVVTRALGHPIRWGLEIYVFLTVWFGLIGGAYTTFKDANVTMDFVRELDSMQPARPLLDVLSRLLSLGFLAILAANGLSLAARTFATGRVTAELQFPVYIHQLSIPLAGLLCALAITHHLIRDVAVLRMGQRGEMPSSTDAIR